MRSRPSTPTPRQCLTAVIRSLSALVAVAIVLVAHDWTMTSAGAPADVGSAAQPVDAGPSVFQATLMEPNQRTPEVSTDELRQILADQSAIVFDSRPHMEYAVSHIPGARNVAAKPDVPISVYISDVAEIARLVPDKDAAIVLYCNGPFCGKSKRLSEELLEAGYTHVRRYQLGAPVWRALVGIMEIEIDGVRHVRDSDRTAVFVDARSPAEFRAGSLSGARNIPLADVTKAKDDGRLPMEDHNTRIIVFGLDAAQARAVVAELAKNAFHNVAYFPGGLDELMARIHKYPMAVAPGPAAASGRSD